MEAGKRGDAVFVANCKDCFQGDDYMFAVFRKQKTKTFISMNKSKSKVKGMEIAIKADR